MGSETTMTVGLGYKTEPWPVAMGSKTTMAVGFGYTVFMALSAMTLPGAKFAEFGKVMR